VRPVWQADLLENELLQEIVSVLASYAMGVANHGGKVSSAHRRFVLKLAFTEGLGSAPGATVSFS
jgi:hypothetical protein